MRKGLLHGLLVGILTMASLAWVGWLFNRKRLKPVGSFLGVPYDMRWPTWEVIKERMWNPQDSRVFTPHVFGWGWSVNLYALGRRLRLLP